MTRDARLVRLARAPALARVVFYQREEIMNRRTACMLTGMTLVGLAIATLPQIGFAQSSPLLGTWKLNLDKSKYTPGPPPRSQTNTFQQDGQDIKLTVQVIDAQGKQTTGVLMHIYDGQPHPSTGNPDFDASAYTRLDANTYIASRFKAGKIVGIGRGVVSRTARRIHLPARASTRTGGRLTTLPSMTSSRSE
jgi:hypothetical protein